MKRIMQVTAAVALSFAVGACAGDRSPDADNTAAGTGAATVGTSGSLEGDREFVDEQVAMSTAEIELGRLAQQRGTHADVKEFGAMMVRDHQTAAEELGPIAARVNADAPARTEDHDDHRKHFEEFSKLSGRDFDRKYIEEMIDDHEDAIEDVERKAENAADPEVKAWAAKALPRMREHLDRARAIKQTLDRASDY